jgi:hypothetical protein
MILMLVQVRYIPEIISGLIPDCFDIRLILSQVIPGW